MRSVSTKLHDAGIRIGLTEEEIEYVAKSTASNINRLVGECNGLDQQIAQLTRQRAALQNDLDTAMALTAKLEIEAGRPSQPIARDLNQ